MPRRRSNPRLALPGRNTLRIAILAALSAAPVLQAATVPPGGALDTTEFLVNSVTSNNQIAPRVARDAAGDFVVVWENPGPGGTNQYTDIYAQRYSTAGRAEGSQFLVNTITGGSGPRRPAVAMDAAGDFVVAWTGYDPVSTSYHIYARQYNAAGTALQASEFQVDTITVGGLASVAMDAAGDFVITWAAILRVGGTANYYDIYARQYNAAGTALQTSEFTVNTVNTVDQQAQVVAMDAAGDFVVAWEASDPGAGAVLDIHAREFNAHGTPLQASEFLVNTFTSGSQRFAAVAMDAAGDFVVSWQNNGFATSTNSYDIYARQFNAAGTALQASEFLVNTYTSSAQEDPSVAMDASGDFVVAWMSTNQAASNSLYDVYARQYKADGTPLQSSEFLVNTNTSHIQNYPAVAADAAGDIVVAWQNDEQVLGPGSNGYDIYARRFEGPETVDLAASLTANSASVTAGGGFSLALGVDNKTAATASISNAAINSALGQADGITATFTLPSGVTAGKASGNNWSCGTASGNTLSCSYSGSLSAAAEASLLTMNFTAPSSAGSLPFQVQVTATQVQSSGDSKGDSANTTVAVSGGSSTGSSGGGGGSSGGGGGSFGLFSLALLGLPLLRRRKAKR